MERETSETSSGSTAPTAPGDLLRGLERWLGNLAGQVSLSEMERELRGAALRLLPVLRQGLGSFVDLVRLFEPAERLDRFGMDARFSERLAPVLEFLCSTWWRVETRDIGNVPSSGPVIVAANHAGVVPWDAFVLAHCMRRDHPSHRTLRPLMDDRECALPLVGPAAIRAGAVRASADAAQRLLAEGAMIGVFPEGSAGARKPWRDRYTLSRFGRGGLVKVALRARAPIVPCAIVGSEEASPGISRRGWVAERLGLPLLDANPSLEVTSLALVPLPSRWSLRFGKPIDVAPHDPAAAADPAVVNELTERVRVSIQTMLDEDVAARSSVFL